MASSDYMKNFGMSIPLDIARHPDGTPMTVSRSEKEKVEFPKWILSKNISLDQYNLFNGFLKELLIKEFRNIELYEQMMSIP